MRRDLSDESRRWTRDEIKVTCHVLSFLPFFLSFNLVLYNSYVCLMFVSFLKFQSTKAHARWCDSVEPSPSFFLSFFGMACFIIILFSICLSGWLESHITGKHSCSRSLFWVYHRLEFSFFFPLSFKCRGCGGPTFLSNGWHIYKSYKYILYIMSF